MERRVGYGRKKRLGELLIDAGAITEEQMSRALEAQKGEMQGQKLGAVLINLEYITDRQIVKALKEQLGYEEVDLGRVRVGDEILKLTDETILRDNNLFPFGFSERNPNILKVAMSDPLDIRAVDDISVITGFQVEIYVTTQKDIAAAIDRYYGSAEAMKVAEQYAKEREERGYGRTAVEAEENDITNQAPIVRLVRQIVEQAVHRRSSDIHIEPMDDTKMRIRFRVDGVLQEAMVHDMAIHSAIIARIKVISGLDIAEKRKPQDGRTSMTVDDQEYDIRVSLLPTVYGEKAVLRLTQKKALTRNRRELGFSPEDLNKFDKILSRPNGIILVTGPTGSGKSTTLYTALSGLNSGGVNIITVEDPVEADIDGVNQVQVNEKAGLTFAGALRSILRQDPDIIMVGEIRDQETAEIAVRASITGHLVLSSVHTNGSASTITRLVDMGVDSYLIADSVIGVIAQRLVRRVCPDCSTLREADEYERRQLGMTDENRKIMIRHATRSDCMSCGGTGYRGRIGVYEIMPITPALRLSISRGDNANDIEKLAVSEGLKTLRQNAIECVLNGVTTLEEVQRVTVEE